MAADELSLLFKLKARNEAKPVVKDAAADVAKLKSTFGNEFGQIRQITNAALGQVTASLTSASNRVPILGAAVNVLTADMAGLTAATGEVGAGLVAVAGPVGIAIAAVAALTTGAVLAVREIFNLSKATAEFQGKLVDLSQQTGVSIETLSALEVQAGNTGGSINTVVQATVSLQRKLDEALDSQSQSAQLFRELGVDATDTETALRQTFAALAAMPEGFRQTNAAAELFGARGGKQVLAILKESQGDLDGTIKRLRDLGVLISESDARAADQFNDELTLLNLQLRNVAALLVRDVIPALTETFRATGDLIREFRPLITLLGFQLGLTARAAQNSLHGLSLAVLALTGNYQALAKAIKDAEEARNISPLTVPSLSPVPLPTPQTPTDQAKDFLLATENALATAKRIAASRNQALDELFQQGRKNREQQTLDVIASNRAVLDAETRRIDAQIDLREKELKALNSEQGNYKETYQKLAVEINKLQQERLDKEAEFENASRALRLKAQKDRADELRESVRQDTEFLVNELDRQITTIESRLDRLEPGTREQEVLVIEQLEQAKLQVRRDGLERQKAFGQLTVQEQKRINDQLTLLGQEASRLEEEQQQRRFARRLDFIQQEAAREVEITQARLSALATIGEIGDEARIATLRSFAELRIRTEEQTERAVLQVRLDAINRQDEIARAQNDAAKAEGKARIEEIQRQRIELQKSLESTGQIKDPLQRVAEATRITKALNDNVKEEIAAQDQANRDRDKLDKELNNQFQINNAQRRAVQEQGNRDIEDGRQKDLNNQRRYNDELEDLRERTGEIERDAEEEVIRLLSRHFANRREAIRRQRDLDIAEEQARHQRVTRDLRRQQEEADQEIRILEKRLDRLQIGTTEEIEEYERLIAALERLRAKRAELAAQQEAEDARSETRKRRVTKDADNAEEETDPFSKLKISVEDLEKITKDIEQSVVKSADILRGAFFGVADAIGSVVANYVLLGETGPAVMRKILAQALASIAAEAAVNAIKELALGFATLFFNPAESAGHFVAAGLWASLAGGAAVAGRGVAGDLFKPKQTGTSGGSGRGSGSGGRNERDPIDLIRQQQQTTITIIVRGEPGPGFNNAIINGVVDDVRLNGPTRTVIKEVAEG